MDAAPFERPAEFARNPALAEAPTEPAGACAVCGGRRFAPIARNMDYELLSCRNVWTFGRCEGCGHVQLDPRPRPEALPMIYPPHYYSYDMARSVGRTALAGKAFLDRLKFRGILDCLKARPQSYLDIGCGDGKYLRAMDALGVPPPRIYGLELDQRAVDLARAGGYQVFAERVEASTSIPEHSIDLATMFHVLEHVSEPGAVLRKIAGWLAPGGTLAIETPNTDSLDARWFRREYWGGYHTPRHWHLFDEQGLRRLLEASGFRVLRTRYQTGHSFWLYSLHHALRYNRRLPMPRLAGLFHPLKSLPMLALATGFDFLRGRLGFRTSAVLVVAQLA
jgi:SAM-dependent methyltransferase